ncbi:N6-adenosine-methyltransferase subunit METTL3 [Brienomyrus brachyistius]|uniref:N6-adenosine-methyltransferase subunit METTL3 n=1 Tax=Brienomyrus brachyistius TaxID=42636 RepID=UPI0020B37125|nr:N6-adenosine-methyltransferase subunit METTL3 [Brienomyrus brachyistius]
MSDTWSNIQAHKKQLDSLRERLQRRRKDTTQLGIEVGVTEGGSVRSDSPVPALQSPPQAERPPDPELERRLLGYLSELSLVLPTDSLTITSQLSTADTPASHGCIQSLLLKFSAQELIEVRQPSLAPSTSSSTAPSSTLVTSVDHTKIWAMTGGGTPAQRTGVKRKAEEQPHPKRTPGSGSSMQSPSSPSTPSSLAIALSSQLGGTSDWKSGGGSGTDKKGRSSKGPTSHLDMEIECLLNQQSTKEQQSKKVSREILELLNTSSAKEQSIVEKFRSRGRAQVQEFCDHGTKEECIRSGDAPQPCTKLHFRRIINKHTDESLGDCSFLNTCFHMDTCKYVHYEIDCPPEAEAGSLGPQAGATELGLHSGDPDSNVGKLFPSQWICCDIRYLDVSILGKFAVVMADPPWDIHMELPYGTLTDDEMRKLNIPILQDDGFLFLWVTGRAMELGRECLSLWGYERVDEIIWVKTNQLQRIIRTGRTGHWLNHGKEHCLVGVKGNPQGFNRGLDCDVIVAEVRSTSHKPDEIYGMIERLSPGTRKIELFGRPHNVQPNWVTLGNQLDGIHLLDPDVVARFKKRYPDGVISKPKNM